MEPSKVYNFREYPFTLTAGGTQNLDVVGDYFRIRAATGALRVTAVEGWSVDPLPGQGLKGAPFSRLVLTDRSGAPNVGTILIAIGADGFVDDRITGEVSVIDSGRSKTIANQVFFRTRSQPAVVGQMSFVGYHNPAGSGRRVAINAIAVQSGVAQQLSLGFATGTAGGTAPNTSAAKLAGGAAGVITTCVGSDAAGSAAIPGFAAFASLFVSANQPYAPPLKEPFVLPEGRGIWLAGTVANADVSILIDSEEFV